jgi:hypothetical protein
MAIPRRGEVWLIDFGMAGNLRGSFREMTWADNV